MLSWFIITTPIAGIIFMTLRFVGLRPPKSWLEPHTLKNHSWDFPPIKRPREEGDSAKELWEYSSFLAMAGSFFLLVFGCFVVLLVGIVIGGWGSVAGASLIVGSFVVFMRWEHT